MSDVLFITGASGSLGRSLTAHFLHHSDRELYLLIHDAGRGYDVPTFLHRVIGVPPDRDGGSRVHLVPGDITDEDVGAPPELYRHLTLEVTEILHCAASTRFDLPLDQARRVNVRGTQTVLHLAQRCRKLKRFGFLSTAYVAGRSVGIILERYAEHTAGFVNSYEQTKYEAEQAVRGLRDSVATAIYRLSTIIGDSRTGRVTHFTAPHQALRIMYLGLAAMIPGTPDYPVDLVPIDHVTRALFTLYTSKFAPGQIFHLVAGSAKSYTLAQMVDRSYRYLADADGEWRGRKYPPPLIVSAQTFELFLQSVEQTGNPLVSGVTRAMKYFARQLTYPKEFDRSSLLACLPEYDHCLPHVDAYYRKIVEYCLRSKWGTDV